MNLRRELERLEKKVQAASEARRRLPAGSSRARVTTANARWARACEARDRVMAALVCEARDRAVAALEAEQAASLAMPEDE